MFTSPSQDAPADQPPDAPLRPCLTSPEIDVLRCAMDGLSPAATAQALQVPVVHVRTVLDAACAKLGCSTKYVAVVAAIRLGYLG